jgi:hypothetical protein
MPEGLEASKKREDMINIEGHVVRRHKIQRDSASALRLLATALPCARLFRIDSFDRNCDLFPLF